MKPIGSLLAVLGGVLVLIGYTMSGSGDGEILNISLLELR